MHRLLVILLVLWSPIAHAGPLADMFTSSGPCSAALTYETPTETPPPARTALSSLYDRQVLETSTPVADATSAVELWYYYAENCGPCRGMKPIVQALEDDGIKVQRVDCTGKDYSDVKAVPVFRFYRDGKQVAPEILGATTEQQLRQSLQVESKPAEAAGTPMTEVRRILAALRPRPNETLVDYGCGDARFLVEAAKSYGCKGVGVEIDAQRAAEATARVAQAGLADKVRIVHGDATTVDVDADVGVVYLYPDVLDDLKPKLEKLNRFASYQHKVDGMLMADHHGFYVWRKPQPVVAQRVAYWNGQAYTGRVCNSPGCRMCNSIQAQLPYGR